MQYEVMEGKALSKMKVIKADGNFELVSWTKNDKVHYAIRGKSSDSLLAVWEPSEKLKGWDLRKDACEAFDHFVLTAGRGNAKGFRTIVKQAKDVEENHVLVWWNDILKEYTFARVYKVMSQTIHFTTHRGSKSCIIKERLDIRLQDGTINVIRMSDVPEGICFEVEGEVEGCQNNTPK